MSDNKKYWVWLTLTLGPSTRNDEILFAFPDPEKLYNATEKERMIDGVFTKRQLEKLDNSKLAEAERIVALCKKRGWQIVTPDDKIYPAGLRKLNDMPFALFVDGDISCLRGKVIIAVVGTRKPCFESIAIARRISSDLSKAGAVVVSGGALGIDSAAHEGTLEAEGKTVCVLGCGFGYDYLRENEPLRRQVSENGAVVTEYPPMTGASRYTFPARNRIISGMSHGVLVVEAGEKSGSLITAQRAADQRRDVFAIPGSILTTAYNGANALIRDGAKAVSGAKDILASYAVMYPDRLNLDAIGDEPIKVELSEENQNLQTVEKQDDSGLDPDCKAVYNLFEEKPLHPDDICADTGIPLSRVATALFRLQVIGYIESDGGKNYKLKPIS
ncbi:MAG: DNA-processing protein DprA [Clostridia bacterium]|nr:DNA-processing protein DprA [Clostridia bacterium]